MRRMAGFHAFDTRGYRTVDARRGYGEWAPTYEQTVEDAMDIDLLEALQGVRWADVRDAADLGCGTGRTGAWLRAHGVAAVDGVDLTPEMLAAARARGVHRRLAVADVAASGLPGSAFDLVVTCLVDEHLADVAPLYRRGGAARPPRRAARARRLPPSLHHGLGHADPLRLRHGRARRDRDPRTPAQRARDGRPRGRAGRSRRCVSGVIDDTWLALKPKWASLRGHPVTFAIAWRKPA